MLNRGKNCLDVVFAALVGALTAVSWPSGGQAQFIYVNNDIAPNNSVSGLAIGPTGTLTAVPGSPFATGGSGSFTPNVGGVSVLATPRTLYATNPVSNTIAALAINSDGTLTTVFGSPFPTLGTRPNGIAINSAGTRLFVTNFVSNNVAVFDISPNGALTQVLSSPFAVSGQPLDVAIDSVNSLLFVSHAAPANAVGVYSIGGGGSLTAIGGSPFPGGGNERGLGVNAAATLLYVADGPANTVSGFTIGGGGTLTAVAGSPFAAGTGASEAVFHPSLSVLYVSNDASNNISTYNIGGGGALTPIVGSPFGSGGTGTAGMVIDAANARLFAVNGGTSGTPSRDVSVFNVTAGTGALTVVGGSPFPTGAATGTPSAIALAVLNRPMCTAASPGVCIPGGGKVSTDCYAEWLVDTDPPPSINPKTNQPDFRVGCQNGNSGCDFDNDATDNHCTFHVRVCINNADPRLACTAQQVASYQILRPKPGSAKNDSSDTANIKEFEKAMSGKTCDNDPTRSCLANGDCSGGGSCTDPAVIGVPFVNPPLAGLTNSTANNCSNVMEIQVPLRQSASGPAKKTKRFRGRVRTSAQVSDTDKLKLTCFPSP